MKRIIALVILAAMCLSLFSCGTEAKADEPDEQAEKSNEENAACEEFLGEWIMAYYGPDGNPPTTWGYAIRVIIFNEDQSITYGEEYFPEDEIDDLDSEDFIAAIEEDAEYGVWDYYSEAERIVAHLGRYGNIFELSEEDGKPVLMDMNNDEGIWYRPEDFDFAKAKD
ncbi:MAG: hypothetical protein IKL24_00280 [Clostridia bacterium]|nr:hypothetical protein [Clostridia bacterium]